MVPNCADSSSKLLGSIFRDRLLKVADKVLLSGYKKHPIPRGVLFLRSADPVRKWQLLFGQRAKKPIRNPTINQIPKGKFVTDAVHSNVAGILLDIEGTTSSISFVYDQMFPFVRAHLDQFLNDHWNEEGPDPVLLPTIELLAKDHGKESVAGWFGNYDSAKQKELVSQFVIEQMDNDIKATGLKSLQGKIWKSGFESGQLKAHLYDDVSPAITAWTSGGIDVRIYSSGSVEAQLLFFGNSVAGNLLPMFGGHYDTQIGSKKESNSYKQIAEEFGLAPENLLFVSDVAQELDAAAQAGFQTILSIRPGNAEVPNQDDYCSIHSFAEIRLAD